MTQVVETQDSKTGEKRALILNPKNMQLAEQWRQDWVVNAEEGTKVSDVLDPQYWAHVAQFMQPYDAIEVRLETGEWLLKLRVINTGRNWAQVFMEHHYELEKRAESMPAALKHRVEWKGPRLKFAVIRIADSSILQDGFADKAAANAWLANHERVTEA